MKELFNGSVSKETANTIKELEMSGVSSGMCDFNLPDGFWLFANKDVNLYLPESFETASTEYATTLIGEAFKKMIDAGVEFFIFTDSDASGIGGLADVQVVYDKGTTDIIGINFDSDLTEEPILWSAVQGSTYTANCISFGSSPVTTGFQWELTGE